MAKIRIKSHPTVAGTTVEIDGHVIQGITSIKFVRTVENKSEPMLYIAMYADDLEIEGDASIIIRPIVREVEL